MAMILGGKKDIGLQTMAKLYDILFLFPPTNSIHQHYYLSVYRSSWT